MSSTIQQGSISATEDKKIRFCPYCGMEYDNGARFCKYCGEPIPFSTKNECNTKQDDMKDGNPTKRETVYEGYIHKCPHCGQVLDSFVLNCPSCGHEIRGDANSKAIQEFAQRLEMTKTTSEKTTIIRNYPIPNTKEDIYEFLILAYSNIENSEDEDLLNAWGTKAEQAITKAELLFTDQTEYKHIEEIYQQILKRLNKERKKQSSKKSRAKFSELAPVLPSAIIVFGWLASLIILIPLCGKNLDNVGFNAYQLLFMVDLIGGCFFVPITFRHGALLPKLIASIGLVLSIVLLIPLCGKNLDNVGFNAYQLLLVLDIICCAVIFSRMLKNKSQDKDDRQNPIGTSLIITIICMFILLVIYAIGSFIPSESEDITSTSSGESESDYKSDTEKIVWTKLVLGEVLPDFGEDEAEVVWDTDSTLILYFYDMNNEKYKDYIEECKNYGFIIDAENSGANYSAYNSDGYYLHLQYLDFSDNKLTIDLSDPIENNEITWPTSDLVKNLPEPKSLIGEVSIERTEAYAVYLTGLEPEYFDEYVSLCKKMDLM